MAVPVLNGNVEGSLRWREQLSRPELGGGLSKYQAIEIVLIDAKARND